MEDQISIFRVEISGWDLKEQFFVERAALEWRQGDENKVLIHRRVRPGVLLFIRLLENSTASTPFPVAYRVREIRERDEEAAYELILRQVWPAPEGQCGGATSMLDGARGRGPGFN